MDITYNKLPFYFAKTNDIHKHSGKKHGREECNEKTHPLFKANTTDKV